jgi:hypothetical protein
MSVFARRIKQMLQLRPEQAWTLRCVVTRNTTAPFCCSIPHHIHTQTTHPRLQLGARWPQSDTDTDRVMVETDTSTLITNTNLNDF